MFRAMRESQEYRAGVSRMARQPPDELTMEMTIEIALIIALLLALLGGEDRAESLEPEPVKLRCR